MDSYRLDLERVIIGSCLLENGYDKVAGILTYRNFSEAAPFDHRTIFKAISAMYPTRPIDLLTVIHELREYDYHYYLAACATQVVSAAHLSYHAFILLQLSMTDALIQELTEASAKSGSITTKAAIQEIIEECQDPSSDVIAIYDGAHAYLQKLSIEDSVLNRVGALGTALKRKIEAIKKKSHIESLIQNLEHIPEISIDARSKFCIGKLTDSIKSILLTGSIDKRIEDLFL